MRQLIVILIAAIWLSPMAARADVVPAPRRGGMDDAGLGLNREQAADLRATVARLQMQHGLTVKTLYAIARAVGGRPGQAIDYGTLVGRIETGARRANEVQAEIRALKATVATLQSALSSPATAALTAAQAAIADGRLADADVALAQLSVLREDDGKAGLLAWIAAVDARAGLAESVGDFARSRMLHKDADAALAALQQRVAGQRWHQRFEAAKADALQGEQYGDTAALLRAIESYREDVLPFAPRDQRPREWAATQAALGEALQIVGASQSSPALLLQSADALRESLGALSPVRDPVDWGLTQNRLAQTLMRLAQRGDRSALPEARRALIEALPMLARDPRHETAIVAQINLGLAATLAYQDASLEMDARDGLRAFAAALAACRPATEPRLCATAEIDRARLMQRCECSDHGAYTADQTVAAFRRAVALQDRLLAPAEWALSRANLGGGLLQQFPDGGDPRSLIEAREEYRAALGYFTRSAHPLEWAQTLVGAAAVEANLATTSEAVDRALWTARLADARQLLSAAGLAAQVAAIDQLAPYLTP